MASRWRFPVAEMFRSNNPVLKEKVFAGAIPSGEAMTIQGTVNKTGLLLLFVVVTPGGTGGITNPQTREAGYPGMPGGALVGFVTAMVTFFKQTGAPKP